MQSMTDISRPRRAARAVVLALIAGMGLSACQNTGDKEALGTVGGAILGGLLGAQAGKGKGQLIAVGAGTLLGGIVGSSIGQSLDAVDRQEMARTTRTALEAQPDHATSRWVNPNSGASGTITPRQTYQRSDGRYCREFTQTVTIGGETEDAYGTACRQPDGTWKIVG